MLTRFAAGLLVLLRRLLVFAGLFLAVLLPEVLLRRLLDFEVVRGRFLCLFMRFMEL